MLARPDSPAIPGPSAASATPLPAWARAKNPPETEDEAGFRAGANIDTTTVAGRLVFGIFAALAEFERELIRERTIAGLSSARARGRNGGRPYTMTPAKLRLAQAAMTDRDTKVGDLCKELGVTRQTLYRVPPRMV
jgi:DNA invertase Pin-like site-specific DNA recombinase